MSVTHANSPLLSEIAFRADDAALAALAERLREGPLRTLLTLHVRAGMMAVVADADDGERLEKLVELVQLAQLAMAQFRDFTLELDSLVDHLATASGKTR